MPITSPAPAPTYGFRGSLSDVYAGDLVGLALDGAHNHLGLPGVVVGDFLDGNPTQPRLLDPSGTLRPGDVYLFTASSLIERLIGVPAYSGSVLSDLLSRIGRAASSTAVGIIGALPIAWHVPNRLQEPPMPVVEHVRLTWSGVFGSAGAPIEQWSWSLKTTAPTTGLDGPALVQRAQAMETTYVANVVPMQPQWVILTQCVYARTGPDGKVLRFPDGAYQQGKIAVVHAGTGSSNANMPLQTALVVSLGTARPGATGKGRLYLPLQTNNIQQDFRVTADYALSVATALGVVVKDINALGSPVSVISSKGYASRVLNTRVGRVPDTMRSRRDKLIEGYMGLPVPS